MVINFDFDSFFLFESMSRETVSLPLMECGPRSAQSRGINYQSWFFARFLHAAAGTMANVLIAKLGATGDVVRTTPLIHRLQGHITWLTAAKNRSLFEGLRENLRCLSWEERHMAFDRQYDLAINLEDTLDVAQFMK